MAYFVITEGNMMEKHWNSLEEYAFTKQATF